MTHEPIEWRGIRFNYRISDMFAHKYETEVDGEWWLSERYAEISPERRWRVGFGDITAIGATAVEALESARSQIESIARAVGLIPEVKP